MDILNAPYDNFILIVSFLPYPSICALELTCKYTSSILSEISFWKSICKLLWIEKLTTSKRISETFVDPKHLHRLFEEIHVPLETKIPIFSKQVEEYNTSNFNTTHKPPSWRELFKIEDRTENFCGEYEFNETTPTQFKWEITKLNKDLIYFPDSNSFKFADDAIPYDEDVVTRIRTDNIRTNQTFVSYNVYHKVPPCTLLPLGHRNYSFSLMNYYSACYSVVSNGIWSVSELATGYEKKRSLWLFIFQFRFMESDHSKTHRSVRIGQQTKEEMNARVISIYPIPSFIMLRSRCLKKQKSQK